jgi:hypothetical protein
LTARFSLVTLLVEVSLVTLLVDIEGAVSLVTLLLDIEGAVSLVITPLVKTPSNVCVFACLLSHGSLKKPASLIPL